MLPLLQVSLVRSFAKAWLGSYTIGPSTNSVVAWWSDSRKKISKDDRQCFDSIVVLICWLLWKERNDRTFDRRVRTVDDTVTWVGDELLAWFQAGFNSLRPAVVVFGGSTGRATIAV